MQPAISLENCPFPVGSVDRHGDLQRTNRAWAEVAIDTERCWDALGLTGTDVEDFTDVIHQVADEQAPLWLDVEVNVLAQRRWSRCHIWPAADLDEVIVAVISLREPRATQISRLATEQIERILEHTADAITIVGEDMSFRFASGIATRWLGVSGTEFEGQNSLSFVFEDDHHILLDAFAQCMEHPRLSVKARFRAVHESGDLIWVEGIGTNMFDDPAIAGILVTLNDITELVQTRATAEATKVELEAEKARYETLAQFTPTGVFELDGNDRLTFHNERFTQLLGSTDEQGFSWDLFDERDREGLREALDRTRSGETTQTTVRLAVSEPDDQGPKWLTIRAALQEDGRVLASVEDHTSQMTKQVELEHRADHDDLTGLPNREHLLERLEELTNNGEPIAVLFLDLDNFKHINDGLGHQVGDEVLVQIAQRIQAVVRPDDIVGRLHGDEFLVVCRHTSEMQTANEIASRVVQSVSQPLADSANGLIVSGSIGIAMSAPDGDPAQTPEQLLVAADVAMYEAKRRGGSRSVTFNDYLGKKASDRLRLHGEVQRASELDELELYYQPIVDLFSGATVRAEALVRWHHPTQGFMLPERFIPEIEKSELIDDLGMWIIDRVISDLAVAGSGSTPSNVNVSPRQIVDESFASSVLRLLDEHSVPGSQLTIEITELVQMEDFSPVERQLRELQRHGIGIAVDDFGTGYSALAYLQRFPFDQIKVDGVFLRHIDTSTRDRAIVQSILSLAENLGATAIAEKVERQAQIDVLTELGCRYAQGFLLGVPVPSAANQ